MKNLLFFFLLVGLTGCAQLQPARPLVAALEPVPVQEKLEFGEAMDLLSATQNPGPLQEFQQLYPQSPWAARAATVNLYVEELTQRKLQLDAKQAELEQLKADNLQLTSMIEQLKKLLIELEQRPK